MEEEQRKIGGLVEFPEKMDSKKLIQFWEASRKIVKGGREYYKLTTTIDPFPYDPGDIRGGLATYLMHSLACSITIQQDNTKLHGQHSEGVISRVFRTKSSEMSPNISFYSIHEYPNKDLALDCGIRLSLCFPVYKTDDHSGRPDGVLEFVSTCDLDLDQVNEDIDLYLYLRKRDIHLSGYDLNSLCPRMLHSHEHALSELNVVLKLLCQSFQLPLAQYWVITDSESGAALSVIHQESNADFENSTPWCNFKKACLHRVLKIGEGLVGKTYISHKSLFCMDISEFSITNHPLVHYVRNYGSIACFTIFLCSSFPHYRECVLEFFLPAQEMDSYHPQTLLDSLLATMKVHLQHYTVASGEQLGQLLSVDVVNYSIHDESKFSKVGQPQSNLPQLEGSENEKDASQQLPCLQLLFEGSTEKDKHVMDLEKSTSNINSDEETSSGEMSNRTPVDDLEEQSHIKCIEPFSLASQPMKSKEILEDEGTTVDADHSALEMILEEAIQHKERVDEMIEESPAGDVGYPTTTTTTSPPSSFQTMKSLSQQKVKEATMVLDTSAQKLIVLEDDLQIPNNRINMGVEKDDTTIHSATKTFIRNTLEREKQHTKDITIESLSEHFGKTLGDTAKSFGVSRSTFKRKLRELGIQRWLHGKRKLDEEPHRKNFSSSGIHPVQDSVVAQASQDLNKMTVKATYNGVTIRFELHGLSGIAELEQNVIERLHLKRESFSIKYQDDEGDWILIACDKDVRECIEVSRSLKKTTIRMLIDPPVDHYAP